MFFPPRLRYDIRPRDRSARTVANVASQTSQSSKRDKSLESLLDSADRTVRRSREVIGRSVNENSSTLRHARETLPDGCIDCKSQAALEGVGKTRASLPANFGERSRYTLKNCSRVQQVQSQHSVETLRTDGPLVAGREVRRSMNRVMRKDELDHPVD